MNWKPHSALSVIGLTLIGAPIYAQAKIYVSVEQAQQLIFPKQSLVKHPIIITDDVQEQMRAASSVRQTFKGDRIWKTSDGGWFIVDEVVGKHEMITYAIGITPSGTVKSIEIMEYVESYGYQVAEASWHNQFSGKRATDVIKLNHDIQNIAGATLSCKHLTDGVKRVMVMYELALQEKTK